MSRNNGNRLHSGSSILHPTKGTNARKLVCPRCNADNGNIMLGARDYAAICPDCKNFNIGLGPSDTKCKKCKSTAIVPKLIPDGMPLPKICDPCTEEVAKQSAIVAAGGVLWRCETCNGTGAFEAEHPIAKGSREDAGGEACLAQLDKDTCPLCP